MILMNDFFKVLSATQDEASSTYEIALNPEHFIYKAHFPGNPITPGVCQLGIVEELLSQQTGQPLLLSHVNNIKYMSIISPLNSPTLQVRFSRLQPTDDGYSLQVLMANEQASFTKMSLQFTRKV
ncbi:MAG: hydroxymyristoyl-ACP dehydratase [Bacteroidales bacterium]|nr:hydroxymyristoyl-ACP dehydratase [Bacteroidales bacterium]